MLADPAEWDVDPWSGELQDGCVWGRGALDMKSQVAAEVAAAVALAEEGWRPEAGELKLVVTADEEAGAEHGAQWLCEQHPEKVRADLVVNEGAGEVFEYDGRRLYGVCVAEKGVFRFTLTASGHGRPRLDPAHRRQRAGQARAGAGGARGRARARRSTRPSRDAFLAALGVERRRPPEGARRGRGGRPADRRSCSSRCSA